MPASPADGERFAARVVPIVDDFEAYLFRIIRDALRAGTDGPEWAVRRLAELQRIRAAAQRGVRDLGPKLEAAVLDITLHAYNTGAALAANDLEDLGADVPETPVSGITAAEQITRTATERFAGFEALLPQLLSAAYSEAVAAGGLEVLGGQVTRLQAAQHVLDRLLGDGIRGFTDAGGRRWTLESYVEMAVRTVTGQAAVKGHTDQLQAAGVDLVRVSDSPRECPLCRPWEGKILSISGQVGAVIVDGTAVKVAASVAAAKSAGLQHPNCTHDLTAYLPGASKPLRAKANPEGYAAKQRQREIERRIRSWKRREQLALTDGAGTLARRKVRQWQAALREHVDTNDLKRLRYRERIGSPGSPLAR